MADKKTVADRLGQTLWTTDLFIPQYRAGEIDDWRIGVGGQLVHDWGYFAGPCLLEMLPSLERRVRGRGGEPDRWETWMSLTPHEIESQELGCRYAFGHTVIMGLGMGWSAANTALNSAVEQVTVIELDPGVIELFSRSGALDSLPEWARRKVVIVQADAGHWTPPSEQTIDFLFVDIWLHLLEPGTIAQVRRMQANVQAATVYFWGQELAIFRVAELPDLEAALTEEMVEQAISRIRLPLLAPKDRDYPALIERAARNRSRRGLRIDADLL